MITRIISVSEELYRKKSMDKIKSPENLSDYIKVSNPGIWLILSAITVLLVGALIWGIFGKLETKIAAVACVNESGDFICYSAKTDTAVPSDTAFIRINDEEYPIDTVSDDSLGSIPDFLASTGYEYFGEGKCPLRSGTYNAEIVTERISPLSLAFN